MRTGLTDEGELAEIRDAGNDAFSRRASAVLSRRIPGASTSADARDGSAVSLPPAALALASGANFSAVDFTFEASPDDFAALR
jgi:hypothetical protein